MSHSKETFHLGICMAGAVTAGSYTAGVMDYLLETLERWQQQKDANEAAERKGEPYPFPDTPMYKVVIDVITGASAGGMCAAISTAMLVEGIKLEEVANKKSKMYKSWVELDDDVPEGTIKKMLEIDDIKDNRILSLLNSKVITNISQKMVNTLGTVNLPPYVDRKLDTILTLSNLYGTRYSIAFQSYGQIKNHFMTMHRDFIHFKLNCAVDPDEDPDSHPEYFEMDFSNAKHIRLFQESAVATGAFPVGLQARTLLRNPTIYKNKINSFIGISKKLENGGVIIQEDANAEEYPSINIDGGLFNNEPFGETEKVLNKKAKKKENEDITYDKTNRTILMIDPFPCEEIEGVNLSDDLMNIVPKIIGAMRSQSLFKTQDLIDSLGEDNYVKYLIVPSKSDTDQPLCCSTLGAFGGFLYREFREHDYHLGRRNAQRFLRKHFVMPYHEDSSQNNIIHKGWTKKAIEIYITTDNGDSYLPIIPDVQIQDRQSDIKSYPKKPYPISKLRELEGPLNARIAAIIEAVEKITSNSTGKEKDIPAIENWFRKSRFTKTKNSIASFFSKPVKRVVVGKFKNKVHQTIGEGTIKWILRDLDKAGLLDEEN